MKKVEFDELQQSRRYRYGYQSFIFLAFLLMFDDALYSVGLVWAQHPVNTFILLLASLTFFISRCIWGDAMVGPKSSPAQIKVASAFVIMLAVVIAGMAIGFFSFHLKLTPPKDGNGGLMSFACLMMWVIIGIVYVVKRVRTSKTEQ